MLHVISVSRQIRVGFFAVVGWRIMAPKSKLTAAVFQERYGDLVARDFPHCITARTLQVALANRQPPIVVSDAMLKVWFQTQRIQDGAVKVSSAEDLQQKCGSFLVSLAAEHSSAYKLGRALKERVPPVIASDGVLKQWLERYCNAEPVFSAAHLELKFGDRIRQNNDARGMDAAALRVWLRTELKVDASERTCQTWRIREWSTADRLLCIADIEASIGVRLRLQQYRLCFTEDAVNALVETLTEGQPPVYLADPILLRQWYVKFHPDSGPTRIATAELLEELLGDELRGYYADMNSGALTTALSRRPKAVLLTRRVVENWIKTYRPAVSSRKRPAGVVKRPAAAVSGGVSESIRKRPAMAAVSGSSSSSSAVVPAPSVLQCIEGVDALEAACGERYRKARTDLGIGILQSEMKQHLRTWGYDVSREACMNWLRTYRLRLLAKDGCNAVYKLSLHDLQYWYHVDKLSPSDLQERYLQVHGIYADRAHLVSWLNAPAQALSILENNESILSDACGEYALQALQNGKRPEEVVELLLREYLVKTTHQRLAAYRHFREQTGRYLTKETLERLHWEPLYALVTTDTRLVLMQRRYSKRFDKKIRDLRTDFCLGVSLAEERVPEKSLIDFFRRHEAYALLPLKYPDATVYKDSLPKALIDAYRTTFTRQALPDTASACMKDTKRGSAWRALKVAKDSGYVAQPRACADAALVASYAMLKCEELFAYQCWSHSCLTLVQRECPKKYPTVDFNFWVKYGSWSRCPHCGSMHFNDSYFTEAVYQDQRTSSISDLLAPVRRIVPTDPLVHRYGEVGDSSRWWYLPGMYRPSSQCGHCTRRPTEKKPEGTAGMKFLAAMRQRRMAKFAKAGQTASSGGVGQDVLQSSELYVVPCVLDGSRKTMAPECAFWPTYRQGSFVDFVTAGDCMLDMTTEECRALQIVVLKTNVQKQAYGAAHHLNWKKIGLSTAYFKRTLVTEASMPTPRAAAAFRYLRERNSYYADFLKKHKYIIENDFTRTISSYDLFITYAGIECAMFPVLSPETKFTDTGLLRHYKDVSSDDSNRLVSIGRSWTRKVLSGVRVYGE